MPTPTDTQRLHSMRRAALSLREGQPGEEFDRGYLAAINRVFDILGIDFEEDAK